MVSSQKTTFDGPLQKYQEDNSDNSRNNTMYPRAHRTTNFSKF